MCVIIIIPVILMTGIKIEIYHYDSPVSYFCILQKVKRKAVNLFIQSSALVKGMYVVDLYTCKTRIPPPIMDSVSLPTLLKRYPANLERGKPNELYLSCH